MFYRARGWAITTVRAARIAKTIRVWGGQGRICTNDGIYRIIVYGQV